jgi:hypothetical protein
MSGGRVLNVARKVVAPLLTRIPVAPAASAAHMSRLYSSNALPTYNAENIHLKPVVERITNTNITPTPGINPMEAPESWARMLHGKELEAAKNTKSGVTPGKML